MLLIICGHSAVDPGAIGNGYQEAERVRALAQRIAYFGGTEVMIGDTSKDWYKEKLINNTNIPKGAKVLELHMDSSPNASAKGAHVVIDADFEPDKWDIALAEFISGILPGRSEIIKKRNDLANTNRAQLSGINYRLLECGFISNAEDVKIFNSRMDEIAKGILSAFDIKVKEQPTQTSNSKFNPKVKEFQDAAIADGFSLPRYGADGVWGAECESVAKVAVVKERKDANGKAIYKYPNLTRIVQKKIGAEVDGKCGDETGDKVEIYQANNGLAQDRCVGINTWKKILGV